MPATEAMPNHEDGPAAPTSSLWDNREFAKLWCGYTIARVGSHITLLALPLIAVLLLGAGATETGLLVAAEMTPSVVAGLFIGVWVDRLPRRPILIVSEVGSALVVGSVPIAAAMGVLTLTQLYVVAFLGGTFAITTDVARGALLPSLVARHHLVVANSRLQASDAVAQVAGPSLGGVLVQVLSAPVAIACDAVSFLFSAAFIAAMRVRESTPPHRRQGSVWADVREGLRWVRHNTIIFRCVTGIALANVGWFAVQALLVVYATRELHLPPGILGLALAAIGPFSLLGAALAGPLTARWGLGRVVILALLLETGSRLVLTVAYGPALQAAALLMVSQALIGVTASLWNISEKTLVQVVTPEHLLGRVTAASTFVGYIVAPPAALAAGLLGDLIGLRPTLFATAVIAGLAFLYLFFSPVRSFRGADIAAQTPRA